MIELKSLEVAGRLEPAKCCPDYDSECVSVADKCACFKGGEFMAKDGDIWRTDLAEGYCPFLIGMRS